MSSVEQRLRELGEAAIERGERQYWLEPVADRLQRAVVAVYVPVVLVRRAGRIYALSASCAHLGGPLSEGSVDDVGIRCPWHGSRFALEDGRILEGPSAFAQPCLNVRVRDGRIELQPRR